MLFDVVHNDPERYSQRLPFGDRKILLRNRFSTAIRRSWLVLLCRKRVSKVSRARRVTYHEDRRLPTTSTNPTQSADDPQVLVHHAPISATHGAALPEAIASWLNLSGSVSKSPTFATDRPRHLICGNKLLSSSEVQRALSRSFPSNISIRISGAGSPARSNTLGSSSPISPFAPAASNAAAASEPQAAQSGILEHSAI